MSGEPGLLERGRQEFERALQRNIKGLDYFTSPAPVMGASAKDVLIERGTLRLYHYRPLSDEIYRAPVLLVMATTNRGYIFDLTFKPKPHRITDNKTVRVQFHAPKRSLNHLTAKKGIPIVHRP